MASVSAMLMALRPTSSDPTPIHFFAQATFFIVSAYIFLGPFRSITKHAVERNVYLICGSVIISTFVLAVIITNLID